MSSVEVIGDPKCDKSDNDKDPFAIHDLPARTSATKLASGWGKKIKTNTTIAENHKRTVLTLLGLQLHFCARDDL